MNQVSSAAVGKFIKFVISSLQYITMEKLQTFALACSILHVDVYAVCIYYLVHVSVYVNVCGCVYVCVRVHAFVIVCKHACTFLCDYAYVCVYAHV